MKKLILTVAAGVALLTVGAATAGGSAGTACTAGQTTYQGLRAKTWCGRRPQS